MPNTRIAVFVWMSILFWMPQSYVYRRQYALTHRNSILRIRLRESSSRHALERTRNRIRRPLVYELEYFWSLDPPSLDWPVCAKIWQTRILPSSWIYACRPSTYVDLIWLIDGILKSILTIGACAPTLQTSTRSWNNLSLRLLLITGKLHFSNKI